MPRCRAQASGASRLAGTPECPIIDMWEATSLVTAGSSGGGGSGDHRPARVALRCVWSTRIAGYPGAERARQGRQPFRDNLSPNEPMPYERGFTADTGLDTAAGQGHRVACSASGQQGPAGRHERGRERLEQLLERGAAVGLTGHERPVDGGEREARELLGDRALRIVAERGRDPFPQELKRVLAYTAHDGL